MLRLQRKVSRQFAHMNKRIPTGFTSALGVPCITLDSGVGYLLASLSTSLAHSSGTFGRLRRPAALGSFSPPVATLTTLSWSCPRFEPVPSLLESSCASACAALDDAADSDSRDRSRPLRPRLVEPRRRRLRALSALTLRGDGGVTTWTTTRGRGRSGLDCGGCGRVEFNILMATQPDPSLRACHLFAPASLRDGRMAQSFPCKTSLVGAYEQCDASQLYFRENNGIPAVECLHLVSCRSSRRSALASPRATL